MEFTQSEQQREKQKIPPLPSPHCKTERQNRALGNWYNNKRSKIHIIQVPEKEEKELGAEKLFK